MKKTLLNTLTVATLFFANAVNAQVGVGVPAADIHPSAELEVKSTTKGFLPPRMKQAERIAIVSPAAGLLVFQTDGDLTNPTGLYFFDGTTWKNGLGFVGANSSLLSVHDLWWPRNILPFGKHNVKWVSGTEGPLAIIGTDYTITGDSLITINTSGRYRVTYEVSCKIVTGGLIDNCVSVWLKQDTGFGIIIINGTNSYINLGKTEGVGATATRSVLYDFEQGQNMFLNLDHFIGDGTLQPVPHGTQIRIERIY